MLRWTYAQLKTKVQDELDLEDEIFVDDDELLSYANEAIDEAEAEIHKLGREDQYFLNSYKLPLVTGTSEYDLPTDIYANKILGLIYNDGEDVYKIRRLRSSKRFLEIEDILNNANQDQEYAYLIKHASATDGYQLVLYPPSLETSSTAVTMWYIRNANRLVASTDICDIPEFANFIVAFMVYKCSCKENHPMIEVHKMNLEQQRKLMVDTLTEMVPDEDNELEMDMTHYAEME